jgi:hypothetical protein
MDATPIEQDRDARPAVERMAARSSDLHVCAECRYAEMLGCRPRAYCGHAKGLRAGQGVFAGQLACGHFAARPAA